MEKKKTTRIDCNHTVLEYIDKQDWRINANANTNYSHASLVNNSSGKIVANFWLDYVYSPEEGDAHRNGDYHIHDLDILAPYCFTADTQVLLENGEKVTFEELVKDYADKTFKVHSLDEQGNSVIGTAHSPRLTRKNAELVKLLFCGFKEAVRCTPDHLFPLVTPEGIVWTKACELKSGCLIRHFQDKSTVVLKGVYEVEEREDVYDLTVDTYHNFALGNGVIVHNCCGHDFQRLLQEGFNGVRGRVNSKPPKHLSEALYQLANFLGILQAEWAGAQAVSSFDTYLAPYLFFDKYWEGMTSKKLKRVMRNFVYNLNVPSRWGQSPFTNVTIDWTVPQTLKDLVPARGKGSYFQSVKDEWDSRDNCPETREDLEESWEKLSEEEKKKVMDEEWEKFAQHAIKRYEEVTKEKFDGDSSEIWLYLTYSFFQKEMNEINKAFYEVLNEGDEQGLPFTFPIPTINITEDFDWNGENTDLLFENTAKMGSSYFQNFIGSQYKRDENGKLVRDENAYSPNDVRSMCCRLQLDKKQLRKRGGGLFGSDAQTGCYDDKTEVLTNNGWKFFKDLTLDDELYTLNSDYDIELHKPSKLFRYDWDGHLYRMKSSRFDLLVTPNHRMVTCSNKTKQIGFCYAEDIKGRIYIPNKTNGFNSKNAPKYKIIGDKKVRTKDWCAFLGWYISEGYFYSNKHRVAICQQKEDGRDKIRKLLKRLPFKFSEQQKEFAIYNEDLCKELSVLGKSHEKHIPEYVFNYNKKSLKALYYALIEGDGTKKRQNPELHSYYTISKQLADDVQRLMILLGNGANCSLIQRKSYDASHYKINRSISEMRQIHKNNISLEYYKGSVYCAEVENHSMCVRRNGRAIWCGNSIGVVTLNMARLGYKHKNDLEALYKNVDCLMDMAKSTLEKKRKFVTDMFNRGLYPYTRRYVRTFNTYFSTIGVNGMNEMVRNFTNDKFDITTPEGQKMCLEILQHIRERLISYQEETGNLYNLEATPAEGTMRRFAHLDKSKYPDIIQAGFDGGTPYYTNSSQLPVDFTSDVFTALDLQDDLQKMYTGGTVLHLYMRERVSSSEACKHLVKSVLTNYRLPYISVTPTFSVCPIHGRLEGEQEFCPLCDAEIIRKHAEEVDPNL